MEQKFVLKDYLRKYGNTSFEDLPLNETDILVFAALSYADFMAARQVLEKYDIWNDEIPLMAFNSHEVAKKLSMRYLSGPVIYYHFFNDVLASKRFSSLKITRIRNVFSKSKNTQFFAMVYVICDFKFIIYRGTDNTIAGWKEDILTAIIDEIPSQKLAAEYANEILKEDSINRYYILGHSKGGNLAYYAFFNLEDEFKSRIIRCYNLDGNGFKNDKFPYKKYSHLLKKVVPNDDVVGTLFDTYEKNIIVRSTSFSIFAHDVLTWMLNPNDFTKYLRVKNLTRASQALKTVFNNWVSKLNETQLYDFIDFIFMLVDLEKTKTINDLYKNLVKNRYKYLQTIENLPLEKKKELRKLSKDFLLDYLNVYVRLSPISQRISLFIKNEKLLREKEK